MKTYIYGVPQGFDFYEKDVQLTDYFKAFYISSRRGRRFLVNRRENGDTIYTYLRYGMKEVSRQPLHAFFGMSVVMENGAYCPDFKIVLEYFDYLFDRFVNEHHVIKRNEEGILEYVVPKFEAMPDDVDWLKSNLPNIFTTGQTKTEHYDASFLNEALGQVASFSRPIGESQLQAAFRKYAWLSVSADIVDKPVSEENAPAQIELDYQELNRGLHDFNAFLLPIAAGTTRESTRELELVYRKVDEILLNLSKYVPTIEDMEERAAFRDMWGKYESLLEIIKGIYAKIADASSLSNHTHSSSESHESSGSTPVTETQYCFSCKRNKPLSEFESPEATLCKECQEKKQAERERLAGRVCVKCGKTKPVSAFSLSGGNVCNTCFQKLKKALKEKKQGKDDKTEDALKKNMLELLQKNRKLFFGALAVLCLVVGFILAWAIGGADEEASSSETKTDTVSTSDSRPKADREIDENELQRLLDGDDFQKAYEYVEGKPKAEAFKKQMKTAFEQKLWSIIDSSKQQQEELTKYYIRNKEFTDFIGFGQEDKAHWIDICKDYIEVWNIIQKKECTLENIARGKKLIKRNEAWFPKDWEKTLILKETILKNQKKQTPSTPKEPGKKPVAGKSTGSVDNPSPQPPTENS